jgi:toluene monooxygenase system ferredoxin subunit
MAFTPVCKASALREGEMRTFHAKDTEVLLVWPEGAAPKAFQSTCPHLNFPLHLGRFNGNAVICGLHEWRFDATTGRGIRPRGCDLLGYPLRVEDDEIQADVG